MVTENKAGAGKSAEKSQPCHQTKRRTFHLAGAAGGAPILGAPLYCCL